MSTFQTNVIAAVAVDSDVWRGIADLFGWQWYIVCRVCAQRPDAAVYSVFIKYDNDQTSAGWFLLYHDYTAVQGDKPEYNMIKDDYH